MSKSIVSSVTLFMDAFQSLVQSMYVSAQDNLLEVQFDPTLDFVEGVARLRSKHQALGTTGGSADPIFLYNRTVLQPPEGSQLRNPAIPDDYSDIPTALKTYKACHAQFDITFAFACEDHLELENFEIFYMSHDSIRALTKLDMNFGTDLGTFSYFLHWNELTGIDLETNGVMRKSVSGSVTVVGWFFIADTTVPTLVKEIKVGVTGGDGGTLFSLDLHP